MAEALDSLKHLYPQVQVYPEIKGFPFCIVRDVPSEILDHYKPTVLSNPHHLQSNLGVMMRKLGGPMPELGKEAKFQKRDLKIARSFADDHTDKFDDHFLLSLEKQFERNKYLTEGQQQALRNMIDGWRMEEYCAEQGYDEHDADLIQSNAYEKNDPKSPGFAERARDNYDNTKDD